MPVHPCNYNLTASTWDADVDVDRRWAGIGASRLNPETSSTKTGWTRTVGLRSAHVLNFETGSMALMGRQAEVKKKLEDAGPVIAGFPATWPAHHGYNAKTIHELENGPGRGSKG